jgi:hypothetical protein
MLLLPMPVLQLLLQQLLQLLLLLEDLELMQRQRLVPMQLVQ